MGSPSANSSDLNLARQLSQRLAFGLPKSERRRSVAPSGGYVAFRAGASPEPIRAVAEPAPAPTPPGYSIPPPPANIRNWDDMLRWCQEATYAKTVFVMDSQGFVIAKEGSWSYEDAEAMGTQIMVALDRFDDLDTFHKRALSVTIEFRSFWLTGIRVPAESRDCFTLGVLRTAPPDPALVQEMAREVSARASEI